MYLKALSEIKKEKKHTLDVVCISSNERVGSSETANYYAIKDLNEAAAYLQHPILGKHLIEITQEVLNLREKR